MSNIPVCLVRCRFSTPDGEPLVGSRVMALLTTPETYNGIIVPQRVEATTDSDGMATLGLWPNQLGSRESSYNVKITCSGGPSQSARITVPAVDTIDMHLIAELPPYPGKTDGQLIFDAVIAAAAPAVAAKDAAELAASSASVSANAASLGAETSTAKAVEASASAAMASTKANEAATSATNAATSAAASLASKNEAATSANAAANSEANALNAKNSASASATDASTSATAAAASASTSTTQAGIATTKAEQAATSASAAATAQTASEQAAANATTGAATATTQAGIATTQATDATTQAGIATAQAGIATAKANLLGSVASTVATGTVTLTSESAVYQLINPNGAARDVVLPTLAAGDAGRSFAVKNTGSIGNYLTLKNAAGTQIGPLVANGYSLAVVWSGTAWEVL